MIWTFLLSNWRTVVLGLALAASAALFSLWRHEVSAYAEFRASVAAQGELAKKHVEQVTAEQTRITDETTKGWAAAIDVVRSDYDARMRKYARGSGLSAIPKAPGSVDAIPADALPFAEQCAETTLQVIGLQDWIRAQENVK